MSWINRLLSSLRRNKLDDQLDDELQFHIEMRTREFIAEGMTPEEARYRARRLFGNQLLLKERTRNMDTIGWIETLGQDLRYAGRVLRKNSGFTAVAVTTLALGIGANTAIFSIIDAVLLKTLPVSNPQQLVLLDWASHGWAEGVMDNIAGNADHDESGRLSSASFSYPIYEEIRARNQVFSNVAALEADGSQLNVGYKGQASRADGELVSGSFFSTLGVQPILGRVLTPDDDRSGASPAAVISYGYWERQFGRDPGTIGRTITVNSVPFTIVGVSPPEFYGVQPERVVEVWLPLHAQPRVEPQSGSLLDAPLNWWVLIMGRLRPGVSHQQARAELELILQRGIASGLKPATKAETVPHLGVEAGSKGLDDLRQEFSRPLSILMTVVGLVLLIACANVANLLLSRARSRQKEIAMRLALGGGRARLVRQLLTESVILSGLGGAAGLILAFLGTHVLVAYMASGREPISLNVTPDPRVLVFTAAVSVLTGILFGLSPALRSTRLDLTPALKENAGDLAAGARGQRGLRLGLGRALAVVQVSLSLVLLVGAGLFVRTLVNLENVKTGFNQRNLLLFAIDPTQDGYKGQRLVDFYHELTHRLEQLPGIRSVTMSGNTLIGGGGNFLRVSVEGYKPKPGQKTGANVTYAGPRFFETLGIPLLLGRPIDQSDVEGASKVAVVSQQFVREFLGGGNPIGRRFGFGGEENSTGIEIAGIVGDVKYTDLRQESTPTIYVPSLQQLKSIGAMHFELRTAGDPMELVGAVRRVARDMDHNLALYDIKSQTEQISQTLFQERLFARLTSFFGVLATLLASVGIYGVMAFAVSRRTREIGIRMALGASRGEITGMVLSEIFALMGIGAAVGMVVALGASRLISSLLYGIRPTDPLTLAIAVLLMGAASGLAGFVPSRRASRVDPMEALRYE
ncbi:MAG TPA: ABC transporter permease [Bryobacteraceae bacterium]|nr:ABC transporter permease [Bryobacteraceae bacterium]